MKTKNYPILITGGTGFIGASLVKRLLDLGHTNINLIVRKSSNLNRIENIITKIKLHEINLLHKSSLNRLVNKIKPSIIFHLSTYSEYRDQEASFKMIKTNIEGTFNLLLATKNINYDIFVNTGSSSEYGIKEKSMRESDQIEPISFYAATKAAATLLCQVFAKEYQKSIITLRPFSVYGPYEEEKRFIPTIIKAIITNQPIKLTQGAQRRDFIYVQDVIDVYIKIIAKGKKLAGQILNIGTGIEHTNDEVVQTLFKIAGKKVKIEKGAYPVRIWDTQHWVADISKTKRLLSWKSKYSLEEGLKKTYFWFRKKYEK